MTKYFSILLILSGICFLSSGGYQLYKTTLSQHHSIKEAQQTIDRFQISSQKKDLKVTNFKPNQNDVVGILFIPRIDAKLPIIEGTDPDDLEKGVGHYKSSAYPGQQNQIVLSGHRDTVFRHMGELKIGDLVTIQLPYGNFSYKIKNTKIVKADDRSIIKSTSPKEVLTITTCYPFSYIGNAPDRYIITAIPYVKH